MIAAASESQKYVVNLEFFLDFSFSSPCYAWSWKILSERANQKSLIAVAVNTEIVCILVSISYNREFRKSTWICSEKYVDKDP